MTATLPDRPWWCICIEDYRRLGRADPRCRHGDLAEMQSEIDRLKALPAMRYRAQRFVDGTTTASWRVIDTIDRSTLPEAYTPRQAMLTAYWLNLGGEVGGPVPHIREGDFWRCLICDQRSESDPCDCACHG